MIETANQNDAEVGVKGFSAGLNLVVMGAKSATAFLTRIVDDPTFLVHVGFKELGEEAARTDYMIKGSRTWQPIGVDLEAAYAALDGPVSQVGALIQLNTRPGALRRGHPEIARVLAHEITLHAMAVEAFRERLLARDAELREQWPDLVAPGGQLGNENQHAAAAFDLNAHYGPLVDEMCAKLRANGHAADAKTLYQEYEDDVMHLKVEYAKRELGGDYLKHHLLAGVKF